MLTEVADGGVDERIAAYLIAVEVTYLCVEQGIACLLLAGGYVLPADAVEHGERFGRVCLHGLFGLTQVVFHPLCIGACRQKAYCRE